MVWYNPRTWFSDKKIIDNNEPLSIICSNPQCMEEISQGEVCYNKQVREAYHQGECGIEALAHRTFSTGIAESGCFDYYPITKFKELVRKGKLKLNNLEEKI